MSLLNIIRNHFRPDWVDDSVHASLVVIEESKQARVQMNEHVRQVRHDAFQTSVDQERIRDTIMNQMIVRKPRRDFLDDTLTNQDGERGR